MIMSTKISIIIPVYNVEKYLAECLDSVVNQTMREIQIICVNDGSTDGSRTILQEYADRDSRIEIIDKANGGASSARNAAYPHIKGTYTLFVDSDDWIERDLCEKTYQKANKTGAPIVVFLYQRWNTCAIPPNDKTTVAEKLPLLDFPAACNKLWQTAFLLGNQLYFPEGLSGEDYVVDWKAITLAEKISIVPEQLYYYRDNPSSVSHASVEHAMDIVLIFDKVYRYLLESDYYMSYREKYISVKLEHLYWHYCLVPAPMKSRFAAMIRDSLTADDRTFYHTAPKEHVSETIKLFYEMIDGDLVEAINYAWHTSPRIHSIEQAIHRLEQRPQNSRNPHLWNKNSWNNIVKMPERLLRRWVVKPLKKIMKAA